MRRLVLAVAAVAVLGACGSETSSAVSPGTDPATDPALVATVDPTPVTTTRIEWSSPEYFIPANATTVWAELRLWRDPTPAKGYLDSWGYATVIRDSSVGDSGPMPSVIALPVRLTEPCQPCVLGFVWERGAGTGSWTYSADFDPAPFSTTSVPIASTPATVMLTVR